MKKISLERIKRGALKSLVLSCLYEKQMYVYEIIKTIQTKTNGFYKPSPGSIYPVLKSLIKEGLVESYEENGKKFYKLTEKGINEYEKIKKDREVIFSDSSPIKKNIINSLFEIGYLIYINKENLDDKKIQQITEILQKCKGEILQLLKKS
ncbi:MAG: PadR family transcriptional regulator [Sulfolobus sp.]|nr:PadR family transcriptional regulator [Sulfolobus sp.]